ncbi:Copia protein, partial [Mucuna pruriens]
MEDATSLKLILYLGQVKGKKDYDIIESNILLLCDNTTAINLSKNLILHSCAKHIQIKHHFIRDYLADIFTKPLPKDKLVHTRNLLDLTFILE